MDEIKLKTDLVNAILQYLGNQKFVEVAGLIQAIQQQAQSQGAQPAEAPEAPAAE
jgi:hypothetical protein